MTSRGPTIVRQLPEQQTKLRRGLFLDEVKKLVCETYRPHLIVDLTSCEGFKAETIDLLLECVEEVEHADGRVSVAATPETAVILELTQLITVLDVFSSVSEATNATPGSGMKPPPDVAPAQIAA